MIQDREQTYTQRVMQAYAEIAAERRSPDIPVHELYRRVGGSLAKLHDWLRAECFAHNCVPTVGEPAFASEEAKRAALTLNQPGASETFLNVKLLEPPPMIEQQREAKPDHERYEELLRATADLRYPPEERTPELEARIEKTIARKVGEFIQERQAKAYEASLRRTVAERHPDLTPDQAKAYDERIGEMVKEYREGQARQKQQAQQQQAAPAQARQQEQGYGMEER